MVAVEKTVKVCVSPTTTTACAPATAAGCCGTTSYKKSGCCFGKCFSCFKCK
jgi:hypothetical protein